MLKTVLLAKSSVQNFLVKFGFLVIAAASIAVFSFSMLSQKASAEDRNNELSHMQYKFVENGQPISGATILVQNQSRTTDENGLVTFEHMTRDDASSFQYIKGKENFSGALSEAKDGVFDIAKINTTSSDSASNSVKTTGTESFLQNPYYTWPAAIGIVLALLLGGFFLYKFAKSKLTLSTVNSSGFKIATISLFILLIVISGFAVYFINSRSTFNTSTEAATSVSASVLDTLPQPQNVKVYADNELINLSWDGAPNASANNIVGYYIRWRDTTDPNIPAGTYTDSRQVVRNIRPTFVGGTKIEDYELKNMTQIQPLKNGHLYEITVQSVQGSRVPDANGSNLMQANGKISPAVKVSGTPIPDRVNAMRNRLTGFFDDFQLPAGNFDEKKWNTAYTACVEQGQNGSYINSQFHAHNQIESRKDANLANCDRGAVFNRPRAIFDTTNATEANPALIEFDFDGVGEHAAQRDIWYVDLVPTDARKDSGIMDTTSHNDIFGGDNFDPGNVLRLKQRDKDVNFQYYPVDGASTLLTRLNDCGDLLNGCTAAANKTGAKYSPSTVVETGDSLAPIPNVRRHWVVEYSPTKIKVFVNGYKILESATPAEFALKKQFYVYNTLFSYNTGKDQIVNEQGIPAGLGQRGIKMSTSVLHWDNFGFTGPAPTTVTHNYIDGGATGTTPFIGSGSSAGSYPGTKRVIKIPDVIGTPLKARLHYTLNNYGFTDFNGSAGTFTLNGKSYVTPAISTTSRKSYQPAVSTNLWYSGTVNLNVADLIQGNNVINLAMGADVINLHIELDYPKASAPAYTQPQAVFGLATYNAAITPDMTNKTTDKYLFFEQDMGLRQPAITPTTAPTTTTTSTPTATATAVPTATSTPVATATATPIPTTTATPTLTATPASGDTVGPVITITSPTNGATITTGNLRMTASATDTSGIYKIQILVGSEIIRTCYGVTACSDTIPNAFITSGSNTVTFIAFDNSTAKNKTTKTVTITKK